MPAVGLDYLGITSDTVFYGVFVSGAIALLARKTLKKLSFEKKAVIFILATIGLRIFFFLTANQNEFPTGEVYFADVPALQHPYQFPWEAPYGVLWYGITLLGTWLVNPFIVMSHVGCPGDCMAELHYLNGTIRFLPYTVQDWNLGISMMTAYTIMSIPFYWLLRKSTLLVGFFITDNFFWATTPVNVPILLLAVLGMFSWKLLPLAPLAKLPFGSELFKGWDVWHYAFTSASSIGHWFPHVMYGIWWAAAIVRWTPWKHAWNFRPNSMELQNLNSLQEKAG